VATVAEHEATPVLRVRLLAPAVSVSTLRGCIRAWLSELGASAEDILDLQLACSEALTMVVEQAATPVALVVDVDGTFAGETATITIREYGLCRDGDAAREGHETLGLALIRAMVDVFDV